MIKGPFSERSCHSCAGTGTEWVGVATLHEVVVRYLRRAHAPYSEDGTRIQVPCITCSATGALTPTMQAGLSSASDRWAQQTDPTRWRRERRGGDPLS
jgi:hypothetical protein